MEDILCTKSRQIITPTELAQVERVDVSTIRRHIKKKKLPTPLMTPGGRVLGWLVSDLPADIRAESNRKKALRRHKGSFRDTRMKKPPPALAAVGRFKEDN